MDHNSPGQTPLWWVIPMMMIPMIDRNKGILSLGGLPMIVIDLLLKLAFRYFHVMLTK